MRPSLLAANASYRLVSLVQHIGHSMMGGHYLAYGKDAGGESESWCQYNDEEVTQVTAGDVERAEGYLLFFQRAHPGTLGCLGAHAAQVSGGGVRRLPLLPLAPSLPAGYPPQPSGSMALSQQQQQQQQQQLPYVYLSRSWWHRFRHFAVPGPITASDILCDHGYLSARVFRGSAERAPLSSLLRVTPAQYAVLARTYGACSPPLTDLRQCPHCEAERAALDARRAEEKSSILSKDGETPRAGEKWYIVSEAWLAHWRAFISNQPLPPHAVEDGTGRGILPPGPIDNARLLRKVAQGSASSASAYSPLPRLVSSKHYRFLNKFSWNTLLQAYGGGPTLTVGHGPVDRKAIYDADMVIL